MLGIVQSTLLYVIPFLFVLTLVVTIHELGHFWVARALGVAVDRFAIGFGRPIVKWVDKDGIEWRVGWIPLGGYVRFSGDAEASSSVPDGEDLSRLKTAIIEREGQGAEKNYFHFKPVWARALVVVAGPVANFILAILLFAVLLGAAGETVVTPRIGMVQPGAPAERAGFKPGDLITAINGRPIDDFLEVQHFVMLRANQPIRFTVQRGEQSLDLTATPERRLSADRLTGSDTRFGAIGLQTSARPGDLYRKRYAPAEALVGGVERTWSVLSTTVFYLGRIVRGLESGGFVALLSLAAVISVGIGFMNLLPVPVLDGGHLLFYAYEALARRPLGASIQVAGYRVGLALLVCLMLFATWNDLQQLRVFKLLGGLFS